mmetsp:Transcript_9586/g.15467  ORF Transcript_9586/g.15467 Transcript_9586/m.15467 type:complete len:92 (-) Transcript_9586:262-537(-)
MASSIPRIAFAGSFCDRRNPQTAVQSKTFLFDSLTRFASVLRVLIARSSSCKQRGWEARRDNTPRMAPSVRPLPSETPSNDSSLCETEKGG